MNARRTETTADTRRLLEACLGMLSALQGRTAPPFPNGVATVEVETSAGRDTTDVRIRIMASQAKEQ